jgi:hypothetical protein
VKVKQSHNTPVETQEERRYSFYTFSTSALDGVSGQLHALATIYPLGKDLRYPFDRRLAVPQSL